MTKTEREKTFKFYEYGAPATDTWRALDCGKDLHCIEGHAKCDWPASKKTLCNRPAKNFHTQDFFSVWVTIKNQNPIVSGGGVAFEETESKQSLLKTLCPACLARAKKQA